MSQNPYSRLKEAVQKWARKVMYPRTRHCIKFNGAENKGTSFYLYQLHESVRTADRCNYDILLRTDGDSLIAELRERPGDAPWEVRA